MCITRSQNSFEIAMSSALSFLSYQAPWFDNWWSLLSHSLKHLKAPNSYYEAKLSHKQEDIISRACLEKKQVSDKQLLHSQFEILNLFLQLTALCCRHRCRYHLQFIHSIDSTILYVNDRYIYISWPIASLAGTFLLNVALLSSQLAIHQTIGVRMSGDCLIPMSLWINLQRIL